MLRLLTCFGAFCLMAACDTAKPGFYGIDPVSVTIDGTDFDVRQNGERAFAVRTNAQALPRRADILSKAAMAMERVTGCEVDTLTGDTSQAEAVLDC